MMEEPKAISWEELDLMTHHGEAYTELRRKNNEAIRRHRGTILAPWEVISEPAEVYPRGFITEVANNELRFNSIVYTYRGLGKLLSNSGAIPYLWESRMSGPISIFNGYIPYKIGKMKEYKYHWRRVYLYEEVLIITKWYAEHSKTSSRFHRSSPEYYQLWNELEDVRDEIKRRATSGKSTIWTSF